MSPSHRANTMAGTGEPPGGPQLSVCGQICGLEIPGRARQAEIATRITCLKQIMEIFLAINQPLSAEQRVRRYIQ